MTTTQLEQLVQDVVARTAATTIARHVDRVAEETVEEILKEHRAEFSRLIHTAIAQALANLNAPPPAGGQP